jgi:hypothetical protein
MLQHLVTAADTAQVTLAAVTGRNLAALSREQLEARRNELHVQLAAVNDAMLRMQAARTGDLAAGRPAYQFNDGTREAGPIDPSDPN